MRFYLAIVAAALLFSFCQRKKAGCMDLGAVNYDSDATLNMNTCLYQWIIRDPSFENQYKFWDIYSPPANSADWANKKDGMMPTDGAWYMSMKSSAIVQQYDVGSNTHFKGFFIDYRYKGKVDANGVLKARVYMQGVGHTIVVDETNLSLDGSDSIIVEKRSDFVALNHWANNGHIFIQSAVSVGTFTFEFDNIRMVQDNEQ